MSGPEGVAAAFPLPGALRGVAPFGSGHINDTFLVRCDGGDRVLQRINHEVFTDPEALMGNVERVCRHVRGRLEEEGAAEVERRVLTVVPTREGGLLHRQDGGWWRMYHRIERVHTVDRIEDARQAFQVGRGFGAFGRLVADLPAAELVETIPHFHDTPRRVAALERAVREDRAGRAGAARPEIDFAMERREAAGGLLELGLPARATHNDTKCNNVLLDDASGEALCVVDLDTVMPGLSLYDFGDMVRSGTNTAEEDERDLSRVECSLEIFRELARGYLSEAGGFLDEAERAHLVTAGRIITYEIGVRFLTDHLEGDRYFKVHRPGHNLDRCRTQFALVASMEARRVEMEAIVREALGEG